MRLSRSDDDVRRQLARTVLGLAVSLADHHGGRLVVCHAWELPYEPYLLSARSTVSKEEILKMREKEEDRARIACLDLLRAHDTDWKKAKLSVQKGPPAEVIADTVAKEGAHLLVMGTVSRTGIPGLLIGNTAELVLREVGCSLLAVKPQGFVTPVR